MFKSSQIPVVVGEHTVLLLVKTQLLMIWCLNPYFSWLNSHFDGETVKPLNFSGSKSPFSYRGLGAAVWANSGIPEDRIFCIFVDGRGMWWFIVDYIAVLVYQRVIITNHHILTFIHHYKPLLPTINHDELPSGKRANITNWKDPPLLMGKSTISTGPWLQ
jgi:hypothetical protein